MKVPPLAAIPPGSLIGRVTGKEDTAWFETSGGFTVNDWLRGLRAIGRHYSDFARIVDFGCGCGRALRHLRPNLRADQQLIGLDIDAEAVGWVKNNLAGVQAFTLGDSQPIPLDDHSVDLVVNHSVFTHLPEDLQFFWLDQLYRILKPGGVAVLTIHGRKVWRDFQKGLATSGRVDELIRITEQFEHSGFYYQPQRTSWEMALPEYYGATFHTIEYIERRWEGGFKLKAWLPVGALAHQDILVFERL